MQRLSDPERRLIDELFWFWPHRQGQAASDTALCHLREGKDKEAEGCWLEQESEHSESSVSTHNLALLYHFRALEHERKLLQATPGSAQPDGVSKLWTKSFRRWRSLADQKGFWNRLTARVRELDDPRLTPGVARRIRKNLPAALLSITAKLALTAIESDRGRRFQETFSFGAPDAKTVCVAGDFNGWDKSHKLQKAPDGVWRIVKELSPGRYEYRFVVDGQWHDDPQCTTSAVNPHGTRNAVRFVGAAYRLADTIRNSGFDQEDIRQGFQFAVEPVRNRIKALCKAAELASENDPVHADKACQQLLSDAKPLLDGLDCLLPANHPTRELAHDDVAERALRCQVAFARKTDNWKLSVSLLESALPVAASESVRKEVQENLEIVRKRADTNDDFCGEGYYDAPAPLLEQLENARKMADGQFYDQAVQSLEALWAGKTNVQVLGDHAGLVNKALAYCLGCRAARRMNEAIGEWNEFKTSVITAIQGRVDKITATAWHCASTETIPQYVSCPCMTCGTVIYGRYSVMKWTFIQEKGPVTLIICGNSADHHRNQLATGRTKLKDAARQSAQDCVDAGQLDPANKFVQGQITQLRKTCSDLEIAFPSPRRRKVKATKAAGPQTSKTAITAPGQALAVSRGRCHQALAHAAQHGSRGLPAPHGRASDGGDAEAVPLARFRVGCAQGKRP
jgi:hypothetical protein